MKQLRVFLSGKLACLAFFAFVLGLGVLLSVSGCAGISPEGHTGAPRNIRSLLIAEVSYSDTYPQTGFAPNLAVLGPSEKCPDVQSATRSCLIDPFLACRAGVGRAWCVLGDGYRYNIQTSSHSAPYEDFWITVTPITSELPKPERRWTDWFRRKPVEPNKPLKTYCATDDMVVRAEVGPLRTVPYTKAVCERLAPLN
jgi:hypothetical protein